MRPIYLCDLDAATRAVLAAPQAERFARAAAIVQAAQTADRYRKRLGRAHAEFGSGTLMSAASHWPQSKAISCDATYRACLCDVLLALAHQSA